MPENNLRLIESGNHLLFVYLMGGDMLGLFLNCVVFSGDLWLVNQGNLDLLLYYLTHFVMLTFSQISGAEKLPAGEGVSAEFVGCNWTLCFYNEEQVCRPE